MLKYKIGGIVVEKCFFIVFDFFPFFLYQVGLRGTLAKGATLFVLIRIVERR